LAVKLFQLKLLANNFEDVIHESHVFANQEGSMVKVWNFLVIDSTWDLRLNPLRVGWISQLVVDSHEHGDWNLVNFVKIELWDCSIAVSSEISRWPKIVCLKVATVN
jgi:hypothetical protein